MKRSENVLSADSKRTIVRNIRGRRWHCRDCGDQNTGAYSPTPACVHTRRAERARWEIEDNTGDTDDDTDPNEGNRGDQAGEADDEMEALQAEFLNTAGP